MVVSSGDHVEFYRSDDLLRWDKTGEFGQGTSLLPHQYMGMPGFVQTSNT